MTFPQSYPQLVESMTRSAIDEEGEQSHAPTRLIDTPFASVALPVPLRQTFDYRTDGRQITIGARVRVPFGRRRLVGVVVAAATSAPPHVAPKSIETLLDDDAVIAPSLMRLLQWAATYYHHPIGDVVATALPAALRRGQQARPAGRERWALTSAAKSRDAAALKRAPLGQRLFEHIEAAGGIVDADQLREVSAGWRPALNRLIANGWVSPHDTKLESQPLLEPRSPIAGPTLSDDQRGAVDVVARKPNDFHVTLINGVTGSGKTEVYLELIARTIAAGRQALVLVPEISLTPQLIARVRQRLGVGVAVFHSGLSDRDRHRMWWSASIGECQVVLGTRSAVYAPLARPGIVIVDEEHDGSFKQQEGFRYHGRDVAIMRAQLDDIPVVLGSATPSLEAMENVRRGRFYCARLPTRTRGALLPTVHLVDLNTFTPDDGLSSVLVQAIGARLERREQSLLFINRRGFAPCVTCVNCSWSASCRRCDAKLTLHQAADRWRCHHCGAEQARERQCPECGHDELLDLGEGTERIEAGVRERFAEARLLRLDRDATGTNERLKESLNKIAAREVDIVIGTQMVAKGHDFPALTLVGVVNTDQALFSVDYRTPEHLMQQLTQVSGRAGRGGLRGDVLVQTRFPHDPVFKMIADNDYDAFVERELKERETAGFPPYAYLALMRAEADSREQARDFLVRASRLGQRLIRGNAIAGVDIMDPVPSPMERRAGRFRAQLLLRARARGPLHRTLNEWIGRIEREPLARKLRWSIDVDPIDLY